MSVHHNQVVEVLKSHFGDKEFTGIEIGTKCGDLTRVLLSAFPNLKKLYTIDPWKHFPDTEFEASLPQEAHDKNKQFAFERLEEFKDRVVILEMTSDEAVKRITEKVSFVHIDGHHTEEQVRKDLENYEPLIKKGGIMSGHDFLQIQPMTEVIKERYGDKIHTGDDFVFWVFL